MSTPLSHKYWLQKARELEPKFPGLKKFRRRKTVRPGERSAIRHKLNIVNILLEPADLRPEKYRKYVFPSDRIIKNDLYYKDKIESALRAQPELARSLRQFRRVRKLKPGQKAYITKICKKLRFADNVFPLTTAMKKRLPKGVRDSAVIPGIRGIKFRQTLVDAALEVDEFGDIIIQSGASRWFYRYTGEDPDSLADAAQAAFDNKAKQVNIWTVHGRVSGGSGDIEDFIFKLKNRYADYIKLNVDKGYFKLGEDQDWLLGIAIRYA